MNHLPQRKAEATCAFSIRIEKDLYDSLCERCLETGDSKNNILKKALQEFLKAHVA